MADIKNTKNGDDVKIAEVDSKHFDAMSKHVRTKSWVAKYVAHIERMIEGSAEWLGLDERNATGVRLLDYACGNGIASRILSPYATTIRGMDHSAGMVEKYNLEAQKAGFAHDKMHAVQGNIMAGDDKNEISTSSFEIIVMCMSLHHVQDTEAMVALLASRLAPGGTLIIIDHSSEMFPDPGHDDLPQLPEKEMAAHYMLPEKGYFSEEEMLSMFKKARLEAGGYRIEGRKIVVPGYRVFERKFFLAKAKKGLAAEV